MPGKDIDKLPFPNCGNNPFYSKEFNVGAMLPQVPVSGPIISKGGFTEPDSIDDLNDLLVKSNIITEKKIERVNDKGNPIPEECPKCGSKIGLYLRGEPVWLCSNKKCGKYFGTLPAPDSLLESTSNINEWTMVQNIWYHLAPKGTDMHLGIISPEYMYNRHMYDLFDKVTDKYRDRLCTSWDIYRGKDPALLSREDVYNGLIQARGVNGCKQIYLFKFPPHPGLGPNMKKVLEGKDVYAVNLSEIPDIVDIDYGYVNSNPEDGKINPNYYKNITPDEYFKNYKDNTKGLLFAPINHISVSTKSGIIPPRAIRKVSISDTGLFESVLKSSIDNNFQPKGHIDLSSLKDVVITKEYLNAAKKNNKSGFTMLKHLRHNEELTSTHGFEKDDELVGYVSVSHPGGTRKDTDGSYNWITALEVSPKYKGYGLGEQLLNYAVKTLHADALGVNSDNEVALNMYKKYGFHTKPDDKSGKTKLMYLNESVNKRSALHESYFGVPEERKYPMPDKKHTISAIKLFGHVEKKYEKELAEAIIKNIKKYDIDVSFVTPKNRLYKYLQEENLVSEAVSLGQVAPSSTHDGFTDIGPGGKKLWNSKITLNGKTYRECAEVLIFKDNKVFLRMKSNGVIRIPGGSTDPDMTMEETCIHEAKEEAHMNIKNLHYVGKKIYSLEEAGWYSSENYTGGRIAHVFIADFDSVYHGKVDKADQDLGMLREGKFYNIQSVYGKLDKVHQDGINLWQSLNGYNESVSLFDQYFGEGSIEEKSQVLFTREITPESLLKIYNRLGKDLIGKVAVKLSSGEPGGNHYLKPELIKDLVQFLDGTIVETNTAYPGKRTNNKDHEKVIADHGFMNIAHADILDSEADMIVNIPEGNHLKYVMIGSHSYDYDGYLVLSHFKGHVMAGFGGAIKNVGIGMASSKGKSLVHSGGLSTSGTDGDHETFLKSLADSAYGIMKNVFKGNVVYINIANNISVDCDCSDHPEPPCMKDIGIFASLDPVAVDQACLDAAFDNDTKGHFRKRVETRNGMNTIVYSKSLGMGTDKYELIDIDKL